MATDRVKLGSNGRLVIPAEYRKAFGIRDSLSGLTTDRAWEKLESTPGLTVEQVR